MPDRYDLVVLGAGCAGLAATEEALRLGLRTLLVDPERPPDDLATVAETGRGRLSGSNRIEVTIPDGSRTEVETSHIVLATGCRPATTPGLEPDQVRIFAGEDLIATEAAAESVAVLGAGACGVAAAGSLAALSHPVTLVETRERILPDHDADTAAVLSGMLEGAGVHLLTGHRATQAEAADEQATVTLLDIARRTQQTVTCDRVLVCLGHRPRSRDLGLENVAVEADRRGHLLVDAQMQTAAPGVYAVGGLVPTVAGAAVAALEGRTAAAHAGGRPGPPLRYRDLPRLVGGPFPLAVVGPGEEQARAEGLAVRVGAVSRPPVGWAKVIVDAESDRLLGVSLIGSGAPDLIAAVQVALTANLDLDSFAAIGWPRPGLGVVLTDAIRNCRDRAPAAGG